MTLNGHRYSYFEILVFQSPSWIFKRRYPHHCWRKYRRANNSGGISIIRISRGSVQTLDRVSNGNGAVLSKITILCSTVTCYLSRIFIGKANNSNLRPMMSANFKQTLQNRPVSLRQRGFLVVECCQLSGWHRDGYTNWKHVSDTHGWTRTNVIWNWQKATLLTGVHLGPHFGEGEVVGGQRCTIWKSDGGFL